MALLLEALRSVDFLADADDETLLRFMVLGKSADFPKRHVFWKAGTPAQALVIPVTGEAKTSIFGAEGREFIDRFISTGQCLGLASAYDGLPHPTDAEVVRAGEFFTITRPNFNRFLEERPELRDKIRLMIGMLYRANMKEREDVALRPVTQRVAEFLLMNACARQADGAKVLVHATQSEFAARLGTVREVVSRILSDFEQRGLIERTENGFFVADWDGLHAEAGLDAPGAGGSFVRSRPADVRTARFFLPMTETNRRRPAEDASGCREHLGDLSLCRERGCPAAEQERRPDKNA